jgi:Ca2+-binding RTX toxin-like protein
MDEGSDIDDMNGGPGRDLLRAGGGDPCEECTNIVYGKDGNDRLIGGPDKDALIAGAGNDFIDGAGDVDGCRGGPGANTIRRCEL